MKNPLWQPTMTIRHRGHIKRKNANFTALATQNFNKLPPELRNPLVSCDKFKTLFNTYSRTTKLLIQHWTQEEEKNLWKKKNLEEKKKKKKMHDLFGDKHHIQESDPSSYPQTISEESIHFVTLKDTKTSLYSPICNLIANHHMMKLG